MDDELRTPEPKTNMQMDNALLSDEGNEAAQDLRQSQNMMFTNEDEDYYHRHKEDNVQSSTYYKKAQASVEEKHDEDVSNSSSEKNLGTATHKKTFGGMFGLGASSKKNKTKPVDNQ